MARKRANLTDLLNNLTFKCLYERYKLVAINAHTWKGLPDGIEERHIEQWLFSDGQCVFFKHPDRRFECLPVSEAGEMNAKGDPLRWIATGYGESVTLKNDECVIIKNNKLRLATEPFIMHYVNKLVEAERTMDVNIKTCKTPIIFACDDNDVLTFKRIFQQVDGNIPAIFADKGLRMDSITAFDTKAKFLGNELMDYKRSVESDLLTFLGQNNNPVDKKERVITDEARANNQLIQSFADLQLEAREQAAREISEMFGQPVTVARRDNVGNPVENVEKEGGKLALS